MNTKKIASTVLLAGAVSLSLVACRDTEEVGTVSTSAAEVVETTTTTKQTQVEWAPTKEGRFANYIHGEGMFLWVDEDKLANVGQSACKALDAGNSYMELVMSTSSNSEYGIHESSKFVAASIMAFCPEYTNQIPVVGE